MGSQPPDGTIETSEREAVFHHANAVLAPAGVTVSPALLAFDVPIMVAVAVLCLPIFFNGMTVFRWEGGLLLSYFVLYTLYILFRAVEHDALHGFVTAVTWVVLPITMATLLIVTIMNLLKRARPGTTSLPPGRRP